MQITYRGFSVDSLPVFAVGRFFAQARIYEIQSRTGEETEIYAAINLPDFGTEAGAIQFANKWAIDWIDENVFEIARGESAHA